jgi:hypothetical protein
MRGEHGPLDALEKINEIAVDRHAAAGKGIAEGDLGLNQERPQRSPIAEPERGSGVRGVHRSNLFAIPQNEANGGLAKPAQQHVRQPAIRRQDSSSTRRPGPPDSRMSKIAVFDPAVQLGDGVDLHARQNTPPCQEANRSCSWKVLRRERFRLRAQKPELSKPRWGRGR